MPVVATVHDFLETARKSNQLDNGRLDAFLATQQDLPADPRKLAALLIRQGVITTFQAEQFLLGKYKGFHLGGYRIIERIGAGGAGTVYLAEHEMMRRRAAIKVLPTPLAEDPAIVERFRIEAQAVATLDHPNVVHLYDFRQENRLYYIVMEYVDGPNLQQVLSRKGPLAPALACEYTRQAAHGFHRDVKPANVLIDSSGTIKVLDLGLARVDRDGESVTRKFNSNAVLGTADFLAPEQALSLHDVDHRADVYGLGATLFSLLTGRPPFDGGTIGQKLMWHQTKVPERVDVLRPEIPAELADVVAKMLAKNPDDRQQTMDEVAEVLSQWADLAPPPSSPSPRSLAEMRYPGTGTGRLGGASTNRMHSRGSANTWVAAEQDTAKIAPDDKPGPLERPLRDVTLGNEKAMRILAVLGGLGALVFVLAAGVVAFLALGPRP
jgi:eukaryotic-like serine/threonine-protein kinase